MRHRWLAGPTPLAGVLFVATAAYVLWRSSTFGVLWDVAYVLNVATRIAAGEAPYRDFPMIQPPFTFIVQAGLIKLFGPHFLVHSIYAGLVGATGTVAAFAATRWMLGNAVPHRDRIALALCLPFVVIGVTSIHAHPFYGADAAWTSLVAIAALIAAHDRPTRLRWLLAGLLVTVPLFAKQNIGLALLASVYAAVAIGALRDPIRRPWLRDLATGSAVALALAALAIHLTAGLPNYLRWTVGSAAEVRPPQIGAILWLLHPLVLGALAVGVAGVALARSRSPRMRLAGIALGASPLIAIAALTPLFPPTADLWWGIAFAGALVAWGGGLLDRDRSSLRAMLPLVFVGVTWGAWLAHGVRGSTRDVWPFLAVPLAACVVAVASATRERDPRFGLAASVLIAAAFTATAVGYSRSNFALSWVDLDGPATASTYPSMVGFGAPGPYAKDLDEILRWVAREVPADDVVVFIPGEDPIYFALARSPRVPSVVLDESSPYTPQRFAEIARDAGLRWVFVKERQQIRPPWILHAEIRELTRGLEPVDRVGGYEVYRRP